MLRNVTLCAMVRIQKMKLSSLIISSSITGMKRKYKGVPLITTLLLKVTSKF